MKKPARAVVVFARAPREEEAAKHLPRRGAGARELFAAMRRRLFRDLAATSLDASLVIAGGGDAPDGAIRIGQRGATFAERLGNAVDDAMAMGFEDVVVIAGDVPELEARQIAEALRALSDRRGIVLGPSPDGGVYLIGISRRTRGVLQGVRWLTPHVAADLRRRSAELAWTVTALAPLRDVDSRLDISRLIAIPGVAPALVAIAWTLVSTRAPRCGSHRAPRPGAAPPSRRRAARAPPRTGTHHLAH